MDTPDNYLQQQQQLLRGRPPLQRRRSEGSDGLPPRSSSKQHQQLHGSKQHQQQQQQQARQRRESLDGGSSPGVGAEVDEQQQQRAPLIKCRNTKCTSPAVTMAEARRSYKSCHNCTCLYCSRECRRLHWQRHRKSCLYSRASSLCVQVLSSIKKNPVTLRYVSQLARRGLGQQGRGAVKCSFGSPEAAEKFVQGSGGLAELAAEPAYVRWSDVLPSEMGAELYAEAVRLCESYNPETRLVLYVSVCVVREVPSSGGAVMWERQPVSRCAKLKLEASCRPPSAGCNLSTITTSSSAASTTPTNITRDMDSPETLVLTSRPPEGGEPTPRPARELALGNVQRHLKHRGVSLRRHFPQVYAKLGAYVDGSVDKFAPVTIYPRDQNSGRSFMCIIMLDAEPERLQLLPTDSSRVKTVDIGIPDPDFQNE